MGDTESVTKNPRAYTSGTKAALFRFSSGKCYYPKCRKEILAFTAGQYLVDVQIAHICAAEPGGPRFDASMSEDDRRGIDNLILLCQAHHNLIDKVRPMEYPVELLRKWKLANEDMAMVKALRDAAADDSNLESILMGVAASLVPTREVTVELAAAVRNGNQGFTALARDFAEVFGPNTSSSPWRLTLVVTVRNIGRMDVVVEGFALEFDVDSGSPVIYFPPAHSANPALPNRLLDGAAGHWPIDASLVRGAMVPLAGLTVKGVRATVNLSSGETFMSDSISWEELVTTGFVPSLP